jgi:hypothetical protein
MSKCALSQKQLESLCLRTVRRYSNSIENIALVPDNIEADQCSWRVASIEPLPSHHNYLAIMDVAQSIQKMFDMRLSDKAS